MAGGSKAKSELAKAIETYKSGMEAMDMARAIWVQAQSELIEEARKVCGENILETRIVSGNWLIVIDGAGDAAQVTLTKLDYVEP